MSDWNIRRRRDGTLAVIPALVALFLLAGCSSVGNSIGSSVGGGGAVQTFYSEKNSLFGANYMTFDHPFTEAGEADALRRAEMQCAQKKQAAVQTSRTCTLQRCTTNFQCMDSAAAAGFSPGEVKK